MPRTENQANQELAQAKAEELAIPNAYADYRELFNDPEIEVVHVLTPNSLHYPMITACIEAGKHVICEKPLAMNSKESTELVRLAKENNIINCVSHNLRYYPLVKQARAMVQAGEIGEVRLVHGHYLQDWLIFETDYNWRV